MRNMCLQTPPYIVVAGGPEMVYLGIHGIPWNWIPALQGGRGARVRRRRVLGFEELIKLAGFAFRPALKELRRASAQAYACCVCKVMFISFVFMCFNMLRI